MKIDIQTVHNKVLQSVTYILTAEASADAFLVDCGDADKILAYLKPADKRLKGIYLTHCHYDHIYGINSVCAEFPEAVIFGSPFTIEGLYEPEINLSKFHDEDDFVVDKRFKTMQLSPNRDIKLFDCSLEMLETPGHDPGCLCYTVDGNIFTGDSYIPFSPVFTKWKHSNKQDAVKSEQRIKGLIEEKGLRVRPGHYE